VRLKQEGYLSALLVTQETTKKKWKVKSIPQKKVNASGKYTQKQKEKNVRNATSVARKEI